MPNEERKAVSLSEELNHVIRAIDGARQLAERLGESMLDDAVSPLSIASTLVVIRERLRLLERVIRRAVDPWLLWCRDHNALEPADDGTRDPGDVILQVWSDKETIRRLRAELKIAKRRLRKVTGK